MELRTTANPLRTQGEGGGGSNDAVHVDMDKPSPTQRQRLVGACGSPKCPIPTLVTSQGKATPLFGHGASPPHILTYDPKQMWNFLAPCMASDITVCTNMMVLPSTCPQPRPTALPPPPTAPPPLPKPHHHRH